MHVIRDLSGALPRGAVFAIGNFDGVHLGHRAMLAVLAAAARRLNTRPWVFTFDPHPLTLLRPDLALPILTTIPRRLELLEAQGVDGVLLYPTDAALLRLSAREFFDGVLCGKLAARGLVEGPNFTFGRNRDGTAETLRGFCASAGLDLTIVPASVSDETGEMTSSSSIRKRIEAGDVRGANRALGSRYRVEGTVGAGAARGRTIGFPTANLEGIATVLPTDGVYAGRLRIGDRWHSAALNLGPNPTFGDGRRKFEVHALDFSGDLYGQTLVFELVDRLRDTRPFASVDDLKAQLARDIERTRALTDGSPDDRSPSDPDRIDGALAGRSGRG
jgi:riboflavin kinase/FMN adenylyltransferase